MPQSPDRLTLTRPDDWHIHLRDGPMLERTVADAARYFARALVMPNLEPPVTTTAQALDYRRRILDALPPGMEFEPQMSLFLHEGLSPQEIHRACDSEAILVVKLYPAGVTTHSEQGVSDWVPLYPVFETMQKLGLPLSVHGEVHEEEVDIFDRARLFLERFSTEIVARFPELKIILEHISTREAVDFVRAARPGVAATITAHHLLYNRNHLLQGGLRPHHYCLPVLKREEHRRAVLAAATGGEPRFFLGTDSAPHLRTEKESACGCAGCYTAHAAMPLYAQVFAQADALHRLEAFAAFHGADFYGLPRNRGSLQLQYKAWRVPQTLPCGTAEVRPLGAGETRDWQ